MLLFVSLIFVLPLLLLTGSVLPTRCRMEKLRSLGLNPNAPKSELVPLLSSQPVDALLDIRDYFFAEATSSNLVPPGDELVSRRSVRGGKPLPQKLSEDVWSLMLCLKQNSVIPRSIVKNGKRGSSYLEASRLSSQSLPTPQSIPTPLQLNQSVYLPLGLQSPR